MLWSLGELHGQRRDIAIIAKEPVLQVDQPLVGVQSLAGMPQPDGTTVRDSTGPHARDRGENRRPCDDFTPPKS